MSFESPSPGLGAETIIALLAFLFPLAFSPGPGNAFFAAIGGAKGLRAAVPALLGYHLATIIVTILLGLGMGAALVGHPVLSRVLSAVGSVYVLWLAASFMRSAAAKGRRTAGTRPAAGEPADERRVGFWAGVILLLFNPKAYYIIAVMFAQFLDSPAGGGVSAEGGVPAGGGAQPGDGTAAVVTISVVFTLNNLLVFIVWTFAGQALTALFTSESSRRWLDYSFAAMLAGVAIWMALPLFT